MKPRLQGCPLLVRIVHIADYLQVRSLLIQERYRTRQCAQWRYALFEDYAGDLWRSQRFRQRYGNGL